MSTTPTHLNYCRQMVKQFSANIAIPNFPPENRAVLSGAIDLARASVKFLLPEGGRLYDDPEYRALDETKELRLPHEFIALEYHRPRPEVFTGDEWSTKAIVFARERDDVIVVTPMAWIDSQGIWGPYPEIAIPRIDYIDRTRRFSGLSSDGKLASYVGVKFWKSEPRVADSDYAEEVGTLMCFLNVLQCRNVHVERSQPGKTRRAMSNKKGALPFDTYHVLTIDVSARPDADEHGHGGEHRSPREHLRRGHIRRLADGRRIWVNATVVAAGRGAGVVSKDYALRSAA